jgi:hypothetical protein
MVKQPGLGTGASHYHNCCRDGGTSPEYFGYHLIFSFLIFLGLGVLKI